MITTDEARAAMANGSAVITPSGAPGTIERLYIFMTPGHPLTGKGRCANVDGIWHPLTELEMPATARPRRAGRNAVAR